MPLQRRPSHPDLRSRGAKASTPAVSSSLLPPLHLYTLYSWDKLLPTQRLIKFGETPHRDKMRNLLSSRRAADWWLLPFLPPERGYFQDITINKYHKLVGVEVGAAGGWISSRGLVGAKRSPPPNFTGISHLRSSDG